MKRLVLLFSLCVGVCLASPAGAGDWNSDGDRLTEKGLGAKNLIEFAENMPWIADGKDTGKYLYVLADAGCSASAELYEKTRKYTDDVQIRWIFVDPQGEGTYNSLYEERTPEALKEAFTARRLPADKDPARGAKIELYVLKAVAAMLMNKSIAPGMDGFGYPTLIYGDSETAAVSIGFEPRTLFAVIKSIPAVPVKENFVPEALTADQGAHPLLPLPAGYRYTNSHAENAPYFLMPDTKSPRVGSVLPAVESPLDCMGVTESGFIAMQITKNGGNIYCFDPEEVKKILGSK